MAQLLDWTRVQRLWNKIKNNFVAKDSSGNVSVDGTMAVDGVATFNDDINAEGDINATGDVNANGGVYVKGASTFEDSVDVKYGNGINLWNENNTKSTTLFYGGEGVLSVGDKALATVADVTAAVANAGHLKREKVSALPGVALAKENVIYMVPNSTTGNNQFDEYMLIDGKFEKTGSSDVDLSGYPTTEQMNTAISNSYTLITDAEIDSLT